MKHWSLVWMCIAIAALYHANTLVSCSACPQSCNCAEPFAGLSWVFIGGLCATIAMVLAWKEGKDEGSRP